MVTLCSRRSSRGCAARPAPPTCGRSSTWTRSSGIVPPTATRRPRSRSSRSSSRPAPSASASSSRRRTRSTSTTRRCRTPARGSSGACRPRTTRPVCSRACVGGGRRRLAAVDTTHSGLGNRQFLLRTPGTDQPRLFTPRWAMSYLRGPLTREQIATLTSADGRSGACRGGGSTRRASRHLPRGLQRRSGGRFRPGAHGGRIRRSRRPFSPRASRSRTSTPAAPWSRVISVRHGINARCGRFSRHASRSATTTRPPGSTSRRSSRRSTARWVTGWPLSGE